MLFNSIQFLIFLPIVFLLYWFVFNRSLRLQNAYILVASYIFYGWWDWRFLLLIAFTSFCSWGSGIMIFRLQDRQKKKIVLYSNIIVNLGILALFKYYDFFVTSFVELVGLIGVSLHSTTLNLILPVGISFYTFQALSYSIDVYRKDIKPTPDIVAYFAYVSFFPQLVAGPIERAKNLLPQILKRRIFDYNLAVDGCRQILWGFFKKVAVADNCAIFVDHVFSNYQNMNGSTLLLAAILFTFQIYGDFSGYSDIAIGVSKLFGIKLKLNFHFPYFSRNLNEFWRRWHISLNTWFVDYVYIPLGGNRRGKMALLRNTMVIFLLSGLWHGANLTYVNWGGYHGVLLICAILLGYNTKYKDVVAAGRLFPSIREIVKITVVFLLVVYGWVIFRADSMTQLFGYTDRMFSSSLLSKPEIYDMNMNSKLLMIMILLGMEWIMRTKEHGLDLSSFGCTALRWSIYSFLLFMIFAFGGNSVNFIYFQF